MPDRYRIGTSSKKKPSRKASKRRLINVLNHCRDPIYNDESGGVYYSRHVRDPVMSWIDIYFPSVLHRGRYFSAALTTLEKMALEEDDEKSDYEASLLFPDAELKLEFVAVPPTSAKGPRFTTAKFTRLNGWDDKEKFKKTIEEKLNATSRKMRPYINIDKDYWYPAIGFHAALNTPSLSTDVIIEMIKKFREMGEPITHGNIWTGEEVEVVPQRLIEAFNKRDAESRSD